MTEQPPVATEWVAWVAENLLRGAGTTQLVETLTAQGLEASAARELVKQTDANGTMKAARKLLLRSSGVEQASRLRRHFERQSGYEVQELSTASFFHDYWCAHRPVVFRNAAQAWPTWTLDDLAERFGDVTIEVLKGRSKTPRWWTRRSELEQPMSLSTLIAHMRAAPTDDLYGVGRNDVLEALPALRDEIGTLPGIADSPSARLWIGPEGTLTPLHHDQSGTWLVQRIGSKRVWLASPLEPALLDTADGVFNRTDPRGELTGDLAEVHWWTIDVHPDDAIFLPAGWWHQVLATSASVSVTLGGFSWPNRFTWYTPGRYQP